MPKVTLGGKRLGSGNRMKVDTRTYNRSTFNLSRNVRTTAACGTLIPFIAEPVLKEDIWKINTQSAIYTAPTIGPLYGSFKVQFDYFFCPQRLYQGILHNNTTGIGLKMGQVKMPIWEPYNATSEGITRVGDSALWAYLGLRRIKGATFDQWYVNATKLLAYYDIYKNYYANKQEPNAKVLGRQVEYIYPTEVAVRTRKDTSNSIYFEYDEIGNWINNITYTDYVIATKGLYGHKVVQGSAKAYNPNTGKYVTLYAGFVYIKRPIENDKQIPLLYINDNNHGENSGMAVEVKTKNGQTKMLPLNPIPRYFHENDGKEIENEQWLKSWDEKGYDQAYFWMEEDVTLGDGTTGNWYHSELVAINQLKNSRKEKYAISIIDFPLENIDKAREVVLTNCRLGDQVKVGATLAANAGDKNVINFPPYTIACGGDTPTSMDWQYEQQGLALKTYQSDIFNNWLETEWIDGENGIAEITAIDTSGGSFKLDQLNLNQKLYNMLNAVAVHGNTYQDWAEATTGYKAYGQAESPIYLGGASCDIVFQEVISTADTETGSAGDQPLGTLAGKGVTANHKGGNIKFTANEFGYIIGLMSITPRVDYSQGNHWDLFNTDMDSWHKPALDGIGFQDLLTTQMEGSVKPEGVGKQTAWIHYQTSYNETFGEFAKENSQMFMTLNRRYELKGSANASTNGLKIKDITTYIDPSKYNYAFAKTSIDSQNFWVQIGMKIETRRLMAARQIPMM